MRIISIHVCMPIALHSYIEPIVIAILPKRKSLSLGESALLDACMSLCVTVTV